MLKQYSVKEIDDIIPPPADSNPNTSSSIDTSDGACSKLVAGDPLLLIGDTANMAMADDSMWNEFFASMPEMEEYDQMFAGLDYYCGPT